MHMTRRFIAFTAAAALLIAALSFMPRPVTSAALGQGWSCSQNAFATTCRHAA
jgi:hypothetical protein